MARKTNTVTGKAFEYAIVSALKNRLSERNVESLMHESDTYETAMNAFLSLDESASCDYSAAAKRAAEMIIALEPNLQNAQMDDPVILSIQADSSGCRGDVRDVVCSKKRSNWQIGISCKHNHEALKHPRITADADFGTTWIQTPCSPEFINKIKNVMKIIESWQGSLWRSHPDKQTAIYLPIINAYIDELQRLCDVNEHAPAKLVEYFFGTDDFYKAIAKDIRGNNRAGLTKIVAFNIKGDLGKSFNGISPLHSVRKITLPTELIRVALKKNSSTTLVMTFDQGWSISMRLHSADSKVKTTGLKWDVQLVGMPNGLFVAEESWLPEQTECSQIEYGSSSFS